MVLRSVFTFPLGAVALAAALLIGAPVQAEDADFAAPDLVVRLTRLENQLRQLSGQIEQAQFENRQLKEQLRKFQEDVEFRFQDKSGKPGASTAVTPQPGKQPRRGDAFDPETTPAAPGAPRPLGSASPSTPSGIGAMIAEDKSGTGPLDLNALGKAAPARPSVAASATGDAKQDYDAAYAYILQRQYEQAETGFRQFLQSHPRDRYAPDAIYWLGESYLQRSRHREAAEQFLKITTDYSRATKAPDAMLKLGISLNGLGAQDQACATLAEVVRKYPQASPSVAQGVARERARAKCPA